MNNYKFDSKMYLTVALNVKKYMKEAKMSLEELSFYSEIKLNYLTKFLEQKEIVAISIYDLYKISIVLNVNINKFFEE